MRIFTQAPAAVGGPTTNTVTFNDKGDLTSGLISNSNTTITNSSVQTGTINTSVIAGAGGSPTIPGNNGGSAGNITIIASGSISTGSLLAFGAGGGAGSGSSANGGAGGAGGSINLSSQSYSILINGDVNSSGGGGGAGGSFSQNSGGSGGPISVQANGGSLTITGVVLAASGGDGRHWHGWQWIHWWCWFLRRGRWRR